MKNAILLHGTGDSPGSFWLPYVRKELERKGYSVWAPQLPEADNPRLALQLPFVLKNGDFNAETVIIAHSAGCPLTLAVLEKISVRIRQAILVAGFVQPIGPLAFLKDILKTHYDWQKIRENVEDFIAIHSDNDPWGCDEAQGKILLDNIGGTLIIRHGEGHMGSNVYQQPYKEFPFLLKLID